MYFAKFQPTLYTLAIIEKKTNDERLGDLSIERSGNI